MIALKSSIKVKSPNDVLCRYTNSTSQFQIIRITNVPHIFFERTVPPKISLVFETVREAQLEVHTNTMVSAILSDIILCDQLVQATPIRSAKSVA